MPLPSEKLVPGNSEVSPLPAGEGRKRRVTGVGQTGPEPICLWILPSNHSNYESKALYPYRLHRFPSMWVRVANLQYVALFEARSFNQTTYITAYEIIRVAVLTNYRFLTKPSWDLALTLQRIYENCRISRLETLFKSRSKPDSGTGIK